MEIFVNVIGQKLKIPTNAKTIISGTRRFIKLTFMLNTDWDNMNVHAHFEQGESTYDTVLDSDNSCYVPSDLSAGTCTLMLYGLNSGSTTIATTESFVFTIDESSYTPSGEESEESGYDEDYVATVSETMTYLGLS